MTRGPVARAAAVLCALLVTTACNDTAGRPRATGSPSAPSASATPTAKAPEGPLVAVITKSGVLRTYRVRTAQRTLTGAVTLAGPAPSSRAVSVSVSGGPSPTVCAVWADAVATLMCYDAGQRSGRIVRTGTAGAPLQVAVSATGRSIAWTAERRPRAVGDPDLHFGRLAGDSVSGATRVPAYTTGTPDPEEHAAALVNGLAWHRDDAVLVTSAFDSDVNGSLYRVAVASPPQSGWLGARVVADPAEQPPRGRFIYAGVESSTSTDEALLVQSGAGSGEGFGNDSRAVRVDLRSGRVVGVVSTPLPNRNMHAVSGGVAGFVYQTVGSAGDVRTYWRNPADPRGEPLNGLPADAQVVVAQP